MSEVETSPDGTAVGGMPVVRDTTFSRCVADRGIVLDLGRDVEIAFLQVGPKFLTIRDEEDGEAVALEPVWTEAARVRLPWPSAVDLAMNILREGIEKDAINVSAVIEAINSYSEKEETYPGKSDD